MRKYLSKYPNLLNEWNYPKNGSLKPENLTHGSHKKVWWVCSKGHEWESVIKKRTSGYGCPYCSGRKVCDDNNLKIKFPEIAKEFHPTKNGELKPVHVTSGSGKKVWWICSKGHEWEAKINNRTSIRRSGCPFCNSHSN